MAFDEIRISVLKQESKETAQASSRRTSYARLRSPGFLQNEIGEAEMGLKPRNNINTYGNDVNYIRKGKANRQEAMIARDILKRQNCQQS